MLAGASVMNIDVGAALAANEDAQKSGDIIVRLQAGSYGRRASVAMGMFKKTWMGTVTR